MADFSVKQKKVKDGVQLTVTGSLTIEYAADMREALLGAFAKGNLVTVDLSALEGIDLSGLQLLCAAHRTTFGQEKQLKVIGSVQPVVRKAAEISGYYRHVGCSQDVQKSCVWVGGE